MLPTWLSANNFKILNTSDGSPEISSPRPRNASHSAVILFLLSLPPVCRLGRESCFDSTEQVQDSETYMSRC